MKYLFFDIECSNCFNGVGKMCEFGYVLTDENFNTLKKDDIPMSPGKGEGNRFHLRQRKGEKDLELAYEYDYYYEQPEFPYFYERIKGLVEDKDTICFAYSMDNDIAHLYHACERYKLKQYNYECYDVQKLVSFYLNDSAQISLHDASKLIVGPNALVKIQEHLSRDDAEMEKLIFEAICEITGRESSSLLKEDEFTHTNSLEFMKEVTIRKENKRLRREGHEFYKTIVISREEIDKEEYIGNRFNVSGDLKAHYDLLKEVVELIKERHGVCVNQLEKTDYFIVLDEDNRNDLIKQLRFPFAGKIITYQEFIDHNY